MHDHELLSIIWRILEIKEGDPPWPNRPWWRTPPRDLLYPSDDTKVTFILWCHQRLPQEVTSEKQLVHAQIPYWWHVITQIWLKCLTHHQFEISALVSRMSFCRETVSDVTKYRLFSQVTSSWSEWNVLPFCTHYQNNSTLSSAFFS